MIATTEALDTQQKARSFEVVSSRSPYLFRTTSSGTESFIKPVASVRLGVQSRKPEKDSAQIPSYSPLGILFDSPVDKNFWLSAATS